MEFGIDIGGSLSAISKATAIVEEKLLNAEYEALKKQIKADHEKMLKKKKAFHEAQFKQEGE